MTSITSLSFVHDYWVRYPGKRCGQVFRVFWNVRPSGDYAADNRTGSRLAIEYLHYAREGMNAGHAGSGTLGLIAQDMPPEHDGVTVGFWSIIGYAAAAGADSGEALHQYWEGYHAENERLAS